MKKFRVHMTVPYGNKFGCADMPIGYADVDCDDLSDAVTKARDDAANGGWLHVDVQVIELIVGRLQDA